MHFTSTFLAVALALTSTHASILKPRQTTGVVIAQFFSEPGCQGTIADDTAFVQDGTSTCHLNIITNPYQSIKVLTNTAIETLHLYNRTNCTTDTVPGGTAGNEITYAPRETGCKNLVGGVGSYKFDV